MKLHPIVAMTPDFESIEQLPILCQQIQDLRDRGVLKIMVCPKFEGAVELIPRDCIMAISIYSSYAGFVPAIDKRFKNRWLHFLGGSPKKQAGYIGAFKVEGALVISADGNGQEKGSSYGTEFLNGKWYRPPKQSGVFRKYDLITKNIGN